MKRNIVVILSLLISISCNTKVEKPVKAIIKKPFIIVRLYRNSLACGNMNGVDSHYCAYTYQDANGEQEVFCDSPGIYHIGDTLK